MKSMAFFWLILLILMLGITACVYTGNSGVAANRGEGGMDAEISAQAAIGWMGAAMEGPLFEDDGGKSLRLAVLEPATQNLGPLIYGCPYTSRVCLTPTLKNIQV
jgi:hypothetical protein